MVKLSVLVLVAICASNLSIAAEDMSRIFLGATPAVSPDGKDFAFEWNGKIWLAPVAGGTAKMLTAGRGSDASPHFSPDGRKLLFGSDRDGSRKLFELDLEKGSVRQASFHSEWTDPKGYTDNGESAVCSVWRESFGSAGAWRVAILPVVKRGREKLLFDAESFDPAIAPNGKSLLFRRRGEELYRKRTHSVSPLFGEIWKYNLKDGKFELMVKEPGDAREPVWAPDGEGFYYVCTEGGMRNVYYRDLAGKERRQITNFTEDNAMQPAISQDGKTMVVRSGFDFWRLDPTAETPKLEKIVLHPQSGYVARAGKKRRWYDAIWNCDNPGDLTFCDNGMQIAFTAGGDLWVMDTVIRQPKLVHGDTITHERECMFSPDGQTLYYLSDRGDGADIWKAERTDSSSPWWEQTAFKRTKLTNDDLERVNFSVSPNGQRLAWLDPLGKINFADTNAVVTCVGPNSVLPGSYAWSPDGNHAFVQITDSSSNRDMWLVSAEGSYAPYNMSRSWRFDCSPTWSKDGKLIAWYGEKPEGGGCLYYAYLRRSDEERDSKKVTSLRDSRVAIAGKAADAPAEEQKDTKVEIEFDGLNERVRMINVAGTDPHFSWDSRTLAFNLDNGVSVVHIPDNLTPRKVLNQPGHTVAWIQEGDKMLRNVNNQPAHNDNIFKFSVFTETDIAEYQELVFRTGWGRLRDKYYDPTMHGVNWNAIKEKYVGYARNAQSPSVFSRIMSMMLGELDASHLGYYTTDASNKEWVNLGREQNWEITTAHLGLKFDPNWQGAGWKVSSVIPNGPADMVEINIKPGDVIVAIDGQAVNGEMDPTEVLNGNSGRIVQVGVQREEGKIETVMINSVTYADIRNLVAKEDLKRKREQVHKRSNNKLGYVHVAAMNDRSFEQFRHELFAEGCGHDGLIVDVRGNGGGYTADRMLSLLCGPNHARCQTRTMGTDGYLFTYWQGPVWTKPIVVLCDEKSQSNAEIFSHAIKTLRRGKLVGRQTAGNVIATSDYPLLDFGKFREPYLGCLVMDGTDMEHNGAMPDLVIDDVPADEVNGLDRQLDAAVDLCM